MLRPATLAALWLAASLPTLAEPFQIVVIPDTQWASQKWPELPRKMTEWIVANQEPQNIRSCSTGRTMSNPGPTAISR
jgi:hypothetical protein